MRSVQAVRDNFERRFNTVLASAAALKGDREMSDKNSETWPLRPSHSASVTSALCAAIDDLLHESGSDMSRNTYLKACGLATAAAVFSNEAARWYFNQKGEDHDLLEGLEDRYVEHDD